MAAQTPLRSDFDAEALRGLAKGSRDPAQTRRLLALSVIAAGGLRSEAAEIGGVGLQRVHDWVVAFNADGPSRLIDGKAPQARPRLNADQREVLKAWSTRDRRRPHTVWCGGGCAIWPRSCPRITACRSPSRP